jgi:hypothetical protein
VPGPPLWANYLLPSDRRSARPSMFPFTQPDFAIVSVRPAFPRPRQRRRNATEGLPYKIIPHNCESGPEVRNTFVSEASVVQSLLGFCGPIEEGSRTRPTDAFFRWGAFFYCRFNTVRRNRPVALSSKAAICSGGPSAKR